MDTQQGLIYLHNALLLAATLHTCCNTACAAILLQVMLHAALEADTTNTTALQSLILAKHVMMYKITRCQTSDTLRHAMCKKSKHAKRD